MELPNLWITLKAGTGNVLQRTKLVEPAERDLIYRYYFGGYNLGYSDHRTLADYLHGLYDNKSWIACGCRDKEEGAFTVKLMNGTLFLSSIPSRREHEEGCPFARTVDRSAIINQHILRSTVLKPGTILKLHRLDIVAGGGSGKPASPPSDQIEKQEAPKLLRILWDILELSGLNELKMNNMRLEEQLDHIKRAVSPYSLDTGIKMHEFTETSMGKLVEMKNKLKESRSRWTSCRPHAIFIVTVPKIDEDRLIFTDSFSVKFEKIIRPFNPDTKGPFLAILTFAEPKGKVGSGWFEAINCAAVPILNEVTLFAVDNEQERKVADSLRWYFHRSNAKVENVVIRKPLHGIYNEMEGLQIRPDFVIRRKLAAAVLEVMDQDDYMDRKARTIPLMENLYGKVWEYGSANKEEHNDLIRIMKEVSQHLEAKQDEISRS